MSNTNNPFVHKKTTEVDEEAICWLPLKETGVITKDRGYVFHDNESDGLRFLPITKPKSEQRSLSVHALPNNAWLCIREDTLVKLLSNISIDFPCENFKRLCARFFEGISEIKIGVFPQHTSFIDEMRIGIDSDLLDNITNLYLYGFIVSPSENLYGLSLFKEFLRLFEMLSRANVGDSFEMKISELKIVINNFTTTRSGEIMESTSALIAAGKSFNLTSINHNNNQFTVTVV